MRFSLFLLMVYCLQAEEFIQETLYPSWRQMFLVSRVLHEEKSPFWDLAIFENPTFGRVLMIDGTIQTTEKDEAIYHEMLVHPALLTHSNPVSVLIIGGGDGGALREVLRHNTVRKVILVEIDGRIIEIAKEYMPMLSKGAFEDSRAQIVIQDAAEYVKQSKENFDVILCDSCDPIGVGKALFTEEFYGHCKERLNEGGIFVNQSGVPFLQKQEFTSTLKQRKKHFKNASFYVAAIPSYVGGFMAFGFSSDVKYYASAATLKKRMANLNGKMRYYTPAIHRAAFQLPQYMLDK